MTPPSIQRALALVLLGLVVLAGREWRVRPDGDVHIHVLDVGQGDGIFITGPSGQQIVIDGGPDLSALGGIGKRMSFFDRSIDLLVLTHPHADHLFSFPELLRRYRVDAVLMTGTVYDQPRYDEFVAMLKERQIPVIIADPSKDFLWDDGLQIDVLWPPPVYADRKYEGDLNDTSVVLKLVYGEDSALFTGDMEELEEKSLLAAGADIDADILKVGHHGSRSSTSTGFLLEVTPDVAIISAGKENSYGHPHRETIERLERFDIPTRVTAQEGTITVKLDGKASPDR